MKAVFQFWECKSTFRFDATRQQVVDMWFELDESDAIFKNSLGSELPFIRIISSIPFCPYCQSQLVMLHNQLVETYQDYQRWASQQGTRPLLTLSQFVDHLLEYYKASKE